MRRLVFVVFTIPFAIILIALSVANRAPVVATIDPFNPGNPALSFSLPLFALVLTALIIGVALGSFLTWVNQGKHRSRAKLEAGRADAIKREAEAIKQERAAALHDAGSALPALRNS
ncbi:MAG: DUF1049 domain-containing protein [Notoacmeibacter sp.]